MMERHTIKLQKCNRGQHLSVLDVLLFRAADCDTDHYLMVTTVEGRLAVSRKRVA
jgi:hypothetical protein